MHEPVTSRPWNRSQHWQQDHAAYNNKSSRKQKAYLQAPNSGKMRKRVSVRSHPTPTKIAMERLSETTRA